MTIHIHDHKERYGLVTRALHWLMALLFAWQFTGMAVKLIVGRAPITAFLVGTHVSVGTLLMLLIVLRLSWALFQHRDRPSPEPGFRGRAAFAGHLALYVLMLVVPLLALLRQLGSGRDFVLFGMTVASGEGVAIEWMTAPANALHRPLAWLLLVMIAGHIAMVVVHRYVWRDDIASRMIGSKDSAEKGELRNNFSSP